jgi:hypothetical protein
LQLGGKLLNEVIPMLKMYFKVLKYPRHPLNVVVIYFIILNIAKYYATLLIFVFIIIF